LRKVCFISDECNGLSSAGGIGACVRGLSQWLVASGARVDILMTNLNDTAAGLEARVGGFVDNVYFLSDVARLDTAIFAPVDEPSKSYAVYRFLRERDYDEVHFNDWLGTGFYTAMARRQGLFGAAVVTHLHGSSAWVREHNLNPPDLNDLEIEGLERSQIENSDLVISPSRYLIEWCRNHGVRLPEAIQRQWILPQWADPDFSAPEGPLRTRGVAAGAIDELVFFGRHERRKGFDIFVEAVAQLPPELSPDITFVGRFDRIAREHTGGLALRRLRDYPGRLRFLHDLKQKEAIAFLKRSPRRLAVMPSLIENSPCVVGECFTAGVPFLASDVGGTAELVAPESRADCLAPADPHSLSKALRRVLEEGLSPLVSTLNPTAIREGWTASVAAAPVVRSTEKPLVSVCFAHYERPHLLRRALEAMQAQSYDHIEIVVVDDGSRSPGAHAYLDEIERTKGRFPVTVIRSDNRYLGAARNTAAKAANGEFLLFHDDDNFAESQEVETFVSAALTYRADVLTAQCYVFHDGEVGKDGLKRRIEYYPFGIGGVFSFFRNRFGDANALVRRSVFEELGGFTEERGVGFEDWEFFLKAFMAGKRMGLVPEPLFNYRANATGMLSSGDPLRDHERIYRAMQAATPRLGADILRYATREHLSTIVLDRTWARLGREREGDTHQQLTAAEPNSTEALGKLRDLALQMGRLAEAVEIGAQIEPGRDALAVLLNKAPAARWKGRAPHIIVLEPGDAREAAFLEGWAIDGAGAALDFSAVWVSGRWLSVAGARRLRRPDVKTLFKLGEGDNVGFRLLAFANGGASAAPAGGLGLFGRPLGKGRTEGLKPMHRAPFEVDDLECNLPSGPGWRGHVDRAAWYRAAKLAPPEPLLAGASIDVETSVPSDPAILWSDGTLDWGVKQAANRARFTRETAGETGFTLLAPVRVRAHVVI
jgi:glycosyltransferase involved in cell wall biosynthesis/GT2 family glycosyltransferase